MSVNETSSMYSMDGALPGGILEEVEPGTNLLVSGPGMSGKRSLMLQLLASGAAEGEGAMVVTTREPADTIRSEYRSATSRQDAPIWVIDAVESGATPTADRVSSVSSPGDLTGIGIEFSEFARDAVNQGVDRIRVGFDSLSPLLMYSDLQRAFRFLHVFTSQIQTRDWVGVFVIDPDAHEDRAVNTVRQLFDGMIELRLAGDDGHREVRVRGLAAGPSEWTPLD